jgi:hypothetical protein
MSLPSAYSGALGHDPEKWFPGFSGKIMLQTGAAGTSSLGYQDGGRRFRDLSQRTKSHGVPTPKHDPEKWVSVFGKDHALTTTFGECRKGHSP